MITFTVASDAAADVDGWRVEHAFGVTATDTTHATESDALGELLEHNVRCRDQWCLRHGGYLRPILNRTFRKIEVADGVAPMLCSLLLLDVDRLDHVAFDPHVISTRVAAAIGTVVTLAEVEHALLHRAAILVGADDRRGSSLSSTTAEGHLLDLLDEMSALADEARRYRREIVSA